MKGTIATALGQTALALLLTSASCQPRPEPTNGQTVKPAPYATGEVTVTIVGRVEGRAVWKFCDGKTLVYITDGYSEAHGIAVVPNSGECP